MMNFYIPQHYQRHCQKLFDCYLPQLKQALPESEIEHIGSSAIPGCISKGDLDIYVAVESQDHTDAISKIENIGFKVKEDTLRTHNLCMLESNKNEDVAIQLVAKGSEFEMFLNFKNALLNDPSLVDAYNQMKRRCSGMSQKQYRKIKSPFIENVLKCRNEKL